MKLWEILPQLKEGQTINVTYKEKGRQDRFIYEEGSLRRVENRYLMNMHKENIEADFEIIPQFIPFEEALAELRKGKRIGCEKENGAEFYLEPGDAHASISLGAILKGKWWAVK